MVCVAFADLVTKERVRKACISKFRGNAYQGSKVFVLEDLSKRVLKACKVYLEAYEKLRAEDKKPFFG